MCCVREERDFAPGVPKPEFIRRHAGHRGCYGDRAKWGAEFEVLIEGVGPA